MASKSVRAAAVIGGTAARAVVGHQSGFRSGYRTEQHLRSLRRDAAVDVDESAIGQARQLRRDGYLFAPRRYPADLVTYLRAGLAMTDDPARSVAMGARIKDSVRYAVDPLDHLPRLRELLTPELASIVRAWYGTEFRISSIRLWRISHVPPDEGGFHHYGNQWHLDGHPLDVMKMFVQVSESAGTDGSALQFLSRPSTRGAFRRGYVDHHRILPTAQRFIEERKALFDDPSGDVAFLDTNRCLHRAGNPPPGGTRGMIQFMFLPAPTPPPDGDYFASIAKDPNVFEGAIA